MRAGARWIATVVVLTLVATGCSGGDDDAATPDSTSTSSTPSTAPPPDHSNVVLPVVSGTPTTLAELRGGEVTLRGAVTGPDGRIPGAIVEVTRLVGNGVTERLATDETGSWQLTELLGGRYRIRAFHPPELTMADPVVTYIEADEQRTFDLRLQKYSGPAVTSGIAPDPAPVGDRQRLTIRVFRRSVDGNGKVASSPLVDVDVTLLANSPWELETEATLRTGGSGQLSWVLTCNRAGTHPLRVQIGEDTSLSLSMPPCGLPPTTTTTTEAAA